MSSPVVVRLIDLAIETCRKASPNRVLIQDVYAVLNPAGTIPWTAIPPAMVWMRLRGEPILDGLAGSFQLENACRIMAGEDPALSWELRAMASGLGVASHVTWAALELFNDHLHREQHLYADHAVIFSEMLNYDRLKDEFEFHEACARQGEASPQPREDIFDDVPF